ncbi:MAG: NAD(P)H-hydrate dehydratase [Deltaproteobacteria bacterium]|nr:NAD(P)H-hydrate dehydratase [Deltaproteobacteria bacterium]
MEKVTNSFLVSAEEMRSFDSTAINQFGIPGIVLMENAGRSTFQILKRLFKEDLKNKSISVVAGPGNNGGDGFVIARYLINQGAKVDTFLLTPRDKIRGDARINLNILIAMRGSIHEIDSYQKLESAANLWCQNDIIVDAILGTGLKSQVRPPYSDTITKINAIDAFKLSVDIPSGVDSDTGVIQGVAIQADITATFGFRKIGMANFPGEKLCGQIEVIDIGIPEISIKQAPPKVIFYDKPDLRQYLQLRSDPTAHKGSFGRALIVGGSTGKTGAPVMTAMAASRIGAGLVTVAVPASLNPILENKLTEEMTEPLPDESGYLSLSAIDRILELCQDKDVVAIGPGLSASSGAVEIVNTLLSQYEGKLVVDADGLNCLAQNPELLSTTKATVVLTPHPGEMGRLTGFSGLQIQNDRLNIGREFVKTYKAWLVLKGARTIIFDPDGRSYINGSGNPWMASGGQGDVLTGIITGLIAQKMPLAEAIPFAVWIHGYIADSVIDRDGPRPVIATDIVKEIPGFIQSILKNYTNQGKSVEQ